MIKIYEMRQIKKNGGTSCHFSGDVVMYPRNTSPEKWVATEHHPCFGDGKWKPLSPFGDDI